jgi:cytochrome c-type biogenesis protein CcmF
MDIAHVTVYKDGELQGSLNPRRDFFPSQGNSSTIADAISTFENDFYVLLVGWEEVSQQSATFKVYINPLINLVWWGSLILIAATAVAMWPHEPIVVRVRQPLPAQKIAKGARA